MSEELTVYGNTALQNTEDYSMSTEVLKRQVQTVQQVMKAVMIKDCHYGAVPGCGNKPVLLKPGAEKLNLAFRFAPRYEIAASDLPGGHREYDVVCNLTSIVSGAFIGSGVGCATTMETKYRFRKAEQTCPHCGATAIIKGKKEYGGGWLCFKNKGGCGAKFKDGDPEIENQEMGRIEHDNPADYYNTVKKMAKKRALIDAVLSATAASDIFEQDLEEMAENGVPVAHDAEPPAPPKQSTKPKVAPPQAKAAPKEKQPEADPRIEKIGAMVLDINGGNKEHAKSWLSDLCGKDTLQGITSAELDEIYPRVLMAYEDVAGAQAS
jgi:hypothetical protein